MQLRPRTRPIFKLSGLGEIFHVGDDIFIKLTGLAVLLLWFFLLFSTLWKVPAAFSPLRLWILHWFFILQRACKFHFQDWITHSTWSPYYGPQFWACLYCIWQGNAAHTVVFQDSSFHRFWGLFPSFAVELTFSSFYSSLYHRICWLGTRR